MEAYLPRIGRVSTKVPFNLDPNVDNMLIMNDFMANALESGRPMKTTYNLDKNVHFDDIVDMSSQTITSINNCNKK